MRLIAVAVGATALASAGLLNGAGPAQAAGPSGCGYGTGGPSAGTICWLDMSGYNETQATSAQGQNLTVSLRGGYQVSFTVKAATNGTLPYTPMLAHAFPTWSGSYMGNNAYLNTPGKPALYGTHSGGTVVSLSNIAVYDSQGHPITSYAFVMADAEATGPNESINFSSDQSLYPIVPSTAQYPYCQGKLTGVGSTRVVCNGTNPSSGHYGAIVLQANSPSRVSAALVHGGVEGVAFAVEPADVNLVKRVDGRIKPTDSFDISVAQGGILGSASTGTADTTATGPVTILNTDPVTLAEAPTPGTGSDLGGYTQDWSCSNSATTSTTSLPSGTGTSKQLSLQPGDDVTCTVTNSAPPIVDTPAVDGEVLAEIAATLALAAGGAFLIRRRRRTG